MEDAVIVVRTPYLETKSGEPIPEMESMVHISRYLQITWVGRGIFVQLRPSLVRSIVLEAVTRALQLGLGLGRALGRFR